MQNSPKIKEKKIKQLIEKIKIKTNKKMTKENRKKKKKKQRTGN